MATKTLTFVKRAEMPVMTRGAIAKGPQVTITSNGQVNLNKAASEAFTGFDIGFFSEVSKESGQVQVMALTDQIKSALEKGKIKLEDVYTVNLKKNAKTGQTGFAGTGICQTIGYDNKKSGNQHFDVQVDTAGHSVTFKLPKGALTPPPVKERKAKAPKATNGASTEAPKTQAAGAGANAAPPSGGSQGEELVLEA